MDDVYFEELDQDIERIEENDGNGVIGPDEAEEAIVTARDVKPKKIIVKPRLKLDAHRLKGPRGLSVLESLFKDVTLKGPGYEKKDLDTVMSLLEHWAHRLFPKMTFDDCLEKIEDLGHKKAVSSYVTLLRMDCADSPCETNEEVIPPRSPTPEPVDDPFDLLLGRPSQTQSPKVTLTQEQRERMERNKLIAMERRKAKLEAKLEKTNVVVDSDTSQLILPDSNAESETVHDVEPITSGRESAVESVEFNVESLSDNESIPTGKESTVESVNCTTKSLLDAVSNPTGKESTTETSNLTAELLSE